MRRRFFRKPQPKNPFVNMQIRAREVRLVDDAGKQLGVVDTRDALKMARERNLDLVQVTEKVVPPVCKITDYGKFLYQKQKKERKAKTRQHTGEIKGIRLSFGISEHDMEVRAKQAEKFLNKGYKVRIEMRLKGRQKALGHFAKEKAEKFLEILGESVSYKVERELKREPRGFTMIVSRKT